MAEDAVWPAIKDIFESIGEIMDTLKAGAFPKITPKSVFALSPGYEHLPDGLKFLYAKFVVALGGEIRCNHYCPKSWNRDGEPKTTLGGIACGAV